MAGESAREVARRARERAERLERRAELFERGAAGEAATAEVLAGLPSEWTALHDVRWPGRRLANVDHVVIGPGGVFVIDSKNWSGRVSTEGGHLRQNGRSREKAVASAADAALAVAELIGPHATHVYPVLCFVGHDEIAGWCRDVMICCTGNLRRMLETRPPVLSAAQIADACVRLDVQLRAATGQVERRRPSRPAHRGPRPARPVPPSYPRRARSARGLGSRRRRQGASVRRFLVGVVALVAFATWGPALAAELGPVLAELMTRNLEQTTCTDDAQASTVRPDC